jgi:hypothetical protein
VAPSDSLRPLTSALEDSPESFSALAPALEARTDSVVPPPFPLPAMAGPMPAVPIEKRSSAPVAEAVALESLAPALLSLADALEAMAAPLEDLSPPTFLASRLAVPVDGRLGRERDRAEQGAQGDDEVPPAVLIHLLAVPRFPRPPFENTRPSDSKETRIPRNCYETESRPHRPRRPVTVPNDRRRPESDRADGTGEGSPAASR